MNKKYILLVLAGLLIIGGMAFFTMNAVQADTAEEIYKKAKAAFENEEYEESAELYHDVLDMDPSHEKARLELGESYIALSDYEAAVQVLNDGIYENPESSSNYIALSDVFLLQKKVGKAVSTLSKGLNYSDQEPIQKKLDQINDKISVHLERSMVQKGYKRDLELVWEDNEGNPVSLEADWKVEDPAIGEIVLDEESGSNQFSADSTGTTVVTAVWESLTYSKEVEVAEQVLDEVTVEPENIEPLAVGQTVEISVEGKDEAGEEMEIAPEWSTEKELIEIEAQEDSDEISVTAVKEGIDTLTLEYQTYKHEMKVKVQGDENLIETDAEGNGTVSVFPDMDTYPTGEEITFDAHPEDGWEFVRWEGDIDSDETDASVNWTVEGSMAVTAVFEPVSYDLDLSIEGEGRIVRDSLATNYSHLADVSLRPRAADGWEFVRWEGSYAGTEADIHVSMDEDKSLTAVFEKKADEEPEESVEEEPETEPESEPVPQPEPAVYQLNVGINGQGNIHKDKSGSQFSKGTTVNLSAVPKDGWTFAGWSTGSYSSNISITMNSDRAISANFKKKAEPEPDPEPKPEPDPEPEPAPEPEPKPEPEPERFTLSTSVEGEGSVEASEKDVQAGGNITVTASPAEGWTFVRWKGDLSGSKRSATFMMDKDKSVTAVFERKEE
ncbi:InlB B-repeat-containing protein [Halobacillus litoralis]|uniref:InlB B-repeat-containing protein n=1 Tax=Halobacillus litoralis TaxID=45668 RepID=UPI001370BB3E|nr:tetratricopeptide repeat protein [Halobacillus litoralis]